MSDAALYPQPQSASQLSENIGDVLASIRRLIAQDEATTPAPASAGAGSDPNSLSRRHEMLAEAQALTRRSEAAFARMPEAPPLTLGPAERVAPSVFDGAIPDTQPDAPAQPSCIAAAETSQGEAENMITPETLSPTGATKRLLPEVSFGTADTESSETPVAPIMNVKHEEPQAPATLHSPLHQSGEGKIHIAPSPQVTPAVEPVVDTPAAIAVSGSPEATVVSMSATPQVIAAPASQTSAPFPQAAAAPAPTPMKGPVAPEITADDMPEEDDCTGTILREMIREVVRQELSGDGGRMSGDLRSMIMREVAQALTQGPRGRR